MKNILIPTDFSETANNAFLYALNIANKLNVKLYVLYSYITPILSSTHAGQPDMLAEMYQQAELSKFDYFRMEVPKLHELAKENGLDSSDVIFLFEEGPVISSVRKVIDREDIYAVVMGTHGASGFTKSIVGTNTVSVIRNTKIPVLAIPTHAKFTSIDKVAFTTLFREKDEKALQEIVNISNKVGFKIYCINVMDDASKPADALLYGEMWRKKFEGADLDFIFLEKKESVEQTINTFMQENDIKLLAIVKRNRSFFDRLINSSLSNKFAFHSETPVWVFHEES